MAASAFPIREQPASSASSLAKDYLDGLQHWIRTSLLAEKPEEWAKISEPDDDGHPDHWRGDDSHVGGGHGHG